MTTKTKLTEAQCTKALIVVAEWLGKRKGMSPTFECPHDNACETNRPDEWPAHKDATMCPKPKLAAAPTGPDAARHALGPELNMTWSWPGKPTPTILLEGGPYDWAIEASCKLTHQFARLGIFAEPYAGYALCLYPDN